MFTPIDQSEMFYLMAESCKGNKNSENDNGFVPFSQLEIEDFIKEEDD
jgi:hypothetical protein